ncbi:MAG: hypothetical protein J1E62_00270, partial [Lachnospiraceae bacterium]|nr:hypothetical protein [Lachnospiraceae bacterium]
MKEMKTFFHNIITHNIGLKILSIIGAVFVWLIIINIDDPYKTKTFQVAVETINENALQSVNKVFEITSGEIASVKVGGRRSVIDKLDATDIRATADLANLSSVNAVAIEPSLRKKVSSEVTLECSQVLKVSLEDMATKQLKITILTEGTPADGYTIGNCTAKPNMVQVTGGRSVIKRITTVKVLLNVEGASEDFSSRLEPVAYDANDEVVRSDTLRFGETKIKVKAKVLDNKTIPVRVDIKGRPAVGYEYVGTECLPQEIEIAGTEKKMDAVTELVIPMDITGLTDTSSQLEKTVDVKSMLPDGITVAPEYETISVKVTIEALIERTIQIKASDISFRNLSDDLIAEVVNPEQLLSIIVTGRTSILRELPDTALNAYVDCNGMKEGR